MTIRPEDLPLGEFAGLPAWRIETAHASAAISPHGGQLLSYVPSGFDDLLWCSPCSQRPPQAIRGGVPVCWPYFGRQGQAADAPQHGPARVSRWQLSRIEVCADDGIELELSLPQVSGMPLRLSQRIRIGRCLEQTLITTHAGGAPVRFTQALHSYFRVGDALRATLAGVDGLSYADKFDGRRHVQSGDWHLADPRDPGRSDRIYAGAGSRFALSDPGLGRRILLETQGSHSLVVWNPGEAGHRAIIDLPADGWRDFVCVETANAGEDVVELAAGATHALTQRISVSRL